MITETTRDNALIAAANGKISFVICQKEGYPEVVNLTKLLGDALTEKNNIFIADVEIHPEVTIPAATEPEKEPEIPPLKAKPRVLPAKRTRGGQGKRSKLDDGKILALFNAGWSYEKIAEEMRVSVSTIYGHISKMREEGKV